MLNCLFYLAQSARGKKKSRVFTVGVSALSESVLDDVCIGQIKITHVVFFSFSHTLPVRDRCVGSLLPRSRMSPSEKLSPLSAWLLEPLGLLRLGAPLFWL